MDIHNSARLTPKGREAMVRAVVDDGLSKAAVARHRFLRSTHIAALVDRSHDRINKRLLRLFHAGYIDRPRAQLDTYPTQGSASMAYAIADRGMRLLAGRDGTAFANRERSRNNARVRRPFIEHQLEVMDFYVALVTSTRDRDDVRLMPPEELVAGFPQPPSNAGNPFAMRVDLSRNGRMQEVGLVPDLAFGLMHADGSKRCFLVEIDRGTMPIRRSDIRQSSFQRKMFAYLAAYAARRHERIFGWRTFRALVVTTDQNRIQSMLETLHEFQNARESDAKLFFFVTRDGITKCGPLIDVWRNGNKRKSCLI